MTTRPSNLSTVDTRYGNGLVTDPNRHGFVVVDYPDLSWAWLRPSSVIKVIAPPPAWTTMTPKAMVWDETHEAYGHAWQDYEDGLR